MKGAKKRYWLLDPSVKQSQSEAGSPAEGHLRRCQGNTRADRGKQCGQWARKGSNYCKWHGGNRPRHQPGKMAGFYSQRAGPVLKKRLQEMQESNPEDRHSLADEIDVARIVADRSVSIYEAVVMNDEGTASLKAKATEALRSSLSHVSELVARAAKVHSVSNSVIELEHIDYILQQVSRIVHEECEGKLEKKLTDRIASIRLPKGNREVQADEQAAQIRDALADIDATI